MASNEQIQYYINIINTAVKGEDVRNAIIELLKMANGSGVNAYTLNGLSADMFAKQSDMDQILPLATQPTENGTKPVSSGGLYNYLRNGIVQSINIILRDNSDGTIASKIMDVADIRHDLMTALNEKGQHATADTAFSDFAGQVRAITTSANFETESLDVSENGDYVPDEGHAYTTVTVDVQPKLTIKTISSLGTFKAKDEGEYDGFSEVTVSLSTGGGSESGDIKLITKSLTSSDFPDAENPGSVTAKASDDEALGYSEVSVDPMGLVGEMSPIEIDANNYGEERTYFAKDDGLYGYSKVTVVIKESEGPFTVEFWVGSNKWDTVEVNRNENAFPSKGNPNPADFGETGKMFARWSPDAINVTRNMKCYAVFKDAESVPAGDEAQASWEEIGSNGGENIEIGAFKRLYYDSFTIDGRPVDGGSIKMYKVASKADGATSTWVSENVIPGTSNVGWLHFSDYRWDSLKFSWDDGLGNECDLKKWLNGDFKSAILRMNDAQHGYSGSIVNYIKSVTKYTNGFDKNLAMVYNTVSSDDIWIPSVRENNQNERNKMTPWEDSGTAFTYVDSHPQAYTSLARTLGQVIPLRGDTSSGERGRFYNKIVGYQIEGAKFYYSSTPTIIVYNPEYVTAYNTDMEAGGSSTRISAFSLRDYPGVRFGFCT